MSNQLDENGFVFKSDDDDKIYLCRMQENEPWFLWLHPDKQWVTLKAVNQTHVWLASEKKIPQSEWSNDVLEANKKAGIHQPVIFTNPILSLNERLKKYKSLLIQQKNFYTNADKKEAFQNAINDFEIIFKEELNA